jgi:hypothetical protein
VEQLAAFTAKLTPQILTPAVSGLPAGQKKLPAKHDDIEARLALYNRASESQKAAALHRFRACEVVADFCASRGTSRGILMAAYTQAAKITGRSETIIRDWYADARRFPRELWPQILCRGCERDRASFMDAHPEVAAFLVKIIAERKGHISNADAVHAALTQFGVPHHRMARMRLWLSEWRAKHAPEILIGTNPDAAKSRLMPAFGSLGAPTLLSHSRSSNWTGPRSTFLRSQAGAA